MSATKDSNQIRARLSAAEREIDGSSPAHLEKAKAHALLAIGHALVNISDEMAYLREELERQA